MGNGARLLDSREKQKSSWSPHRSLRSSRFLSFSRRRSKVGDQRSKPGVSKKMGRSGKGVSEKGDRVGIKGIAFPSLASPPPFAPYFSHSLPVSFPSRKLFSALPPSFVPFAYVFGNACYIGCHVKSAAVYCLSLHCSFYVQIWREFLFPLAFIKVISFTQVLIRVERTTEVVPTTVSEMDLNTTVHVVLGFDWKAIFTTAKVKRNGGLWYAVVISKTFWWTWIKMTHLTTILSVRVAFPLYT